jgi:hypothetical protein
MAEIHATKTEREERLYMPIEQAKRYPALHELRAWLFTWCHVHGLTPFLCAMRVTPRTFAPFLVLIHRDATKLAIYRYELQSRNQFLDPIIAQNHLLLCFYASRGLVLYTHIEASFVCVVTKDDEAMTDDLVPLGFFVPPHWS